MKDAEGKESPKTCYLLDVNVLIASIWSSHEFHAKAKSWIAGKELATCPLAELGFIRVSTLKRVFALPMEPVREALALFLKERKVNQIPDDLMALESRGSKTAEDVTDHYLADLAARHGLKLATFDQSLKHPAVELISAENSAPSAGK